MSMFLRRFPLYQTMNYYIYPEWKTNDLTIFLSSPITYDYKCLLAFKLTYILSILFRIYPEGF